jgi:putative MATE family efflux protein
MNEQELMGKAKISTAVAKMAIPSVISSLVTVVYNMADTFFVGQTNDALQVAAVSLTNPIFILLMAFANMLGMGGSAVLSMALGEQNDEKVKRTSAFVTYASLGIGLIVMAVLLIFTSPILHIFGADATTYDFARGYTNYIAIGAPFIIWSAAASFIVRAEGASSEAMIGSMIGTVMNIILDPIFISGFGWGAAGAAVATTIGNMLAAAYYLYYFLRKSKHMSILPNHFSVKGGLGFDICRIGLPTAIFSALMSVSTIVLNQILVAYGNDAVAAIGIVFKANMFITFFQMGIANGIQPLLGFNYGSGDKKRFLEIERFTRKCLIISGVICTLIYFIFRYQVVGLFISDENVIARGVPMLVGYMLSGPFIGILFLNMNCMQSVGKPMPATILSILRQGVLLIPLLYLLQAVAGINGVIYGQSITDYIAIILSIIIWKKIQ